MLQESDIRQFNKPVGYIAPDGKLFLNEEDTEPFVHLHLGKQLFDMYKETYCKNVIGYSTSNVLENAGFIKIHYHGVTYYPHYRLSDNKYTPDITDYQRQALFECCHYLGYLNINDGGAAGNTEYIISNPYRFFNMDLFAIRKLFEF